MLRTWKCFFFFYYRIYFLLKKLLCVRRSFFFKYSRLTFSTSPKAPLPKYVSTSNSLRSLDWLMGTKGITDNDACRCSGWRSGGSCACSGFFGTAPDVPPNMRRRVFCVKACASCSLGLSSWLSNDECRKGWSSSSEAESVRSELHLQIVAFNV